MNGVKSKPWQQPKKINRFPVKQLINIMHEMYKCRLFIMIFIDKILNSFEPTKKTTFTDRWFSWWAQKALYTQ